MGSVQPGIYPDDSITRRVSRENVLLLGGGRALLMQLAHPSVAAGVDEHSDFRVRPIRRFRRTIRMTMAIIFGDRNTALAAARAVNRAHAGVKGAGYRAMDPDLLMWVHATLVDTSLLTYETFVSPLSQDERETFYQESKVGGELLGIPRDRFPRRLADFDDYVRDIVACGEVKVGQRALELSRQVLRPPVTMLPGVAMIPFEVVTAGLLPTALREQYGLAWGRRRQQMFRLATRTVPHAVALTPPILRVWPLPGHSVSLKALATS